jgi:hypothetical protein
MVLTWILSKRGLLLKKNSLSNPISSTQYCCFLWVALKGFFVAESRGLAPTGVYPSAPWARLLFVGVV